MAWIEQSVDWDIIACGLPWLWGAEMEIAQCGLHKMNTIQWHLGGCCDLTTDSWAGVWAEEPPNREQTKSSLLLWFHFSFLVFKAKIHHLYLITDPADLLLGLRTILLAHSRSTCCYVDDCFSLGQVTLRFACSWPPSVVVSLGFPNSGFLCYSQPMPFHTKASQRIPFYLYSPVSLRPVSHQLAWQSKQTLLPLVLYSLHT